MYQNLMALLAFPSSLPIFSQAFPQIKSLHITNLTLCISSWRILTNTSENFPKFSSMFYVLIHKIRIPTGLTLPAEYWMAYPPVHFTQMEKVLENSVHADIWALSNSFPEWSETWKKQDCRHRSLGKNYMNRLFRIDTEWTEEALNNQADILSCSAEVNLF